MFPKTKTYVKSYNSQTKWIYLLIEDHDLMEKYNNTVCDKVNADIKKEFHSKLVYNERIL